VPFVLLILHYWVTARRRKVWCSSKKLYGEVEAKGDNSDSIVSTTCMRKGQRTNKASSVRSNERAKTYSCPIWRASACHFCPKKESSLRHILTVSIEQVVAIFKSKRKKFHTCCKILPSESLSQVRLGIAVSCRIQNILLLHLLLKSK
jgi:hypothetical protein